MPEPVGSGKSLSQSPDLSICMCAPSITACRIECGAHEYCSACLPITWSVAHACQLLAPILFDDHRQAAGTGRPHFHRCPRAALPCRPAQGLPPEKLAEGLKVHSFSNIAQRSGHSNRLSKTVSSPKDTKDPRLRYAHHADHSFAAAGFRPARRRPSTQLMPLSNVGSSLSVQTR